MRFVSVYGLVTTLLPLKHVCAGPMGCRLVAVLEKRHSPFSLVPVSHNILNRWVCFSESPFHCLSLDDYA